MSTGQRLASAFIAGILLLQFLAAFRLTPGPIDGSPWLWPFLDYPMYSRPHFPGDSLRRPEVFAVHADSSEVRIEGPEIGLNFWLLRRGMTFSIVGEDTSRVRNYAALYESRTGERLRAFRVYHRPLVLRTSGVEPAGRYLHREFVLDGADEP